LSNKVSAAQILLGPFCRDPPCPDSDAEAKNAMSSSPEPAQQTARGVKRRKLRKGTHSCWECKRRKMKCVLDPRAVADGVCIGCRRRGTKCVGQEFPGPEEDDGFQFAGTALSDTHISPDSGRVTVGDGGFPTPSSPPPAATELDSLAFYRSKLLGVRIFIFIFAYPFSSF
jgi:hypothetical protein